MTFDYEDKFLAQPVGSYPAGTKLLPGMVDEAYCVELEARGAIIKVTRELPPELPEPSQEKAKKAKKAEKPKISSQWHFDPKSLEGLSLDALNMMILDHAEKYGREIPEGLFDDVETAIAFLSSELS